MRQIQKLQPPTSLIQFRARAGSNPGLNFDDYDGKQTLREQLVQEQRGLCCFCLCRIRAGEPGTIPLMKIAHWHSQRVHEDERFDYSNLLGACMGGEGNPPHLQHCDTRQGHRDIKWSPAIQDHRIEDKIRFLADGTIVSDDPEFDQEINEVLNLNVGFLVTNRKYVLDSFQASLGKRALTPREREKMLQDWNGESHTGELEPYCQVVVCWLRKRLERA